MEACYYCIGHYLFNCTVRVNYGGDLATKTWCVIVELLWAHEDHLTIAYIVDCLGLGSMKKPNFDSDLDDVSMNLLLTPRAKELCHFIHSYCVYVRMCNVMLASNIASVAGRLLLSTFFSQGGYSEKGMKVPSS